MLDAIGSEDIISKMSDIFYSNSYSSNMYIVEGFCQGLKYYRDRGIYVSNRNHIRPTAQLLNAVGGSILLDMYSVEEVKNLVIERINLLMNGKDTGLVEEIEYSQDTLTDTENDSENDVE